MRIKHWLFIGIILSASVAKADNSTFIDEHFAQDSVLVLLNGAFVSAALEAICRIAVPGNQGRTACQNFAPEATTFLYLAKNQWPTSAMEVWSSLNIAFFAVAIIYIRHGYGSPIRKVRMAMACMTYPLVMQMMANTASRYLTGLDHTKSPVEIPINGLSTGLIAGGVALWFMYKQTSQYRPFYLFVTSSGTTFILSLLYFYLEDSGEIIFSKKVTAVAGVAAIAVAVDGLVVRAETEVVAIAAAVAAAGVGAAALAQAAAIAEVGTVAENLVGTIIGAGTIVLSTGEAITGIFIIMLTKRMTSKLRQSTTAFPMANLIMVAVAGLPLMVNSWVISWCRFIEANTTAHETMQGEFIISLNKMSAFYPENWIRLFQVWERSTD